MKRVLYYVEAWNELSPDFRFGAFGDAVHQLHLLKKHAPELDCRLLIGDGVLEAIAKKNYTAHADLPTAVLHTADLRHTYRDYRAAAHAFMNRSATDAELDQLAALSQRALGDFVPDVILMHETHAPFLSRAFPQALLLHTMYGMTYRMPYPQLSLFDDLGLYQHSVLAVHAEQIRATPVPVEDKRLLGQVRNWFAAQILPHDPVWPLIEPDQSRYDKLILVPLQVDGYYAFEECSRYVSQVEFLEDVLERTPRNWGVVVTGHSEYKPALDELTVARLRRHYPNLIYSPALNAIPYVSQALLAHVDAVVSVSSSLAFQALIFDCPVVAAGHSHINAVATCTLDDIAHCFDQHVPGARDAVLYFLLTRYHLATARHVHDGAGLYSLLTCRHQAFAEGLVGLAALGDARPLSQVHDEIKGLSQWRAWTHNLKGRSIRVQPHPVLARMVFNEAVSFDLFDTLVDRPFTQPHELFQFIEPMVRQRSGNIYFPFHHLRREAERKARDANGHRIEVTLDEIYAQLQLSCGFSRELMDEIQALEVKAEMSLIGPRRGMVRAWRLAGCWSKWRSILTDIYLEEHVIRSLLDKHDLIDFDLLFVSATERIRKDDGSVYPEYMARLRQLDPCVKAFLHVGDNPRADGEMARPFGIETVIIPTAMAQLRKSELGKVFQGALNAPSFDSSIQVGMLANRFFSAPTSAHKPGSLCDGNLFNIGYGVLGPFVLGYVQWVVRRMRAHKIDHAYFLARDGYLVMKVYEAMKRVMPDLPDHSYLYCSRRGVMVPAIENDRDIHEIATLNYGTTSVKNFLRSRYGLEANELPAAMLRKHGIKPDGSTLIGYPRDLALTIRLVTDLKPYIHEKAAAERATYMRYLEQEGVCDRNRRSAFVDIGYSGTMQRKVSEMTGVDYHGYYMLTHNYVLHHFRDQVFEAWLEEYDSQRANTRHPFNQYIPLIESLLSSTEGSFVCFHDKDGRLKPEYLYASNERERCAFVEGLHVGAMAFIDDYLQRFGCFGSDFEFSPQVASFPMFRFGENPAPADVAVFEGLILENLFAGAEFSVIANPNRLLDAKGKLSTMALERLLSESKWKQGAQVAYRKYHAGPVPVATPAKLALPVPVAVAAPKVAAVPAALPRIETQLQPVVGFMSQGTRQERLMRKLKTDPQRFFADARMAAVRPLRHLFANNTVGRISTSMVRALL